MSIRTWSRKAHPEAWAQRTRFNRLRRLTQQAERAKGQGDVARMARIGNLLRRLTGENVFEDNNIRPDVAAPTLVQRGVSGIRNLVRRVTGRKGDR